MPVLVKLPTILRKHAGGEPRVDVDGATLRELLGNLEARFPGITKNVVTEDGGLHRFVNVYVNDEDVRYLGSLETEVKEGDTVSILPAVAGGSA
jgi:MoaD family protein